VRASRLKADSLWRSRDFTLFFAGEALSSLGNSMGGLAYPLMVLWLTGSALWAGVVGTLSQVAWFVAAVPAGVIIDRVDRKRAMMVCDVLFLLTYGTLGVLILGRHVTLPVVLVLVVIDGACSSFFQNAALTAIRHLVPRDRIAHASATTEARTYAIQLIGPPLGGVTYGIGRALPFLIDAGSYLASLLGLSLVRGSFQEEREPAAEREGGTSAVHEFLEGLRYVVRTPLVRAIVLVAAPLNFALNGAMFGIVLVLRQHGVAAGLIGTAETALAIGGLLGALLAPGLLRWIGALRLVQLICVLGVPLLVLIWPLSHSPVAAVPVGVLTFFGPPLNAAVFSRLSGSVPDELQGRVMTAFMGCAMGMTALAPLVVGVLVHHWNAVGLVVGVVAVQAVASVTALTSKGIKEFVTPHVPV